MKTSKASRQEILHFLDTKKVAIAGVSRNPKKFGFLVYQELKKRGYELYPVNPSGATVDGIQFFPTVSDIPAEVKHLVVLTPKKETEKVVMEAVARGIDHLWIQQMSDTPEAVRIAREAGVKLITGQCIFMWAEPVTGVHKFHRFFMKLFRLLPG